MNIVVWFVVAGALVGLVASDFEIFGLLLGAFVGAVMGRWFRTLLVAEIEAIAGEIRFERPDAPLTEPRAEVPETVAPRPVAQPSALNPAATIRASTSQDEPPRVLRAPAPSERVSEAQYTASADPTPVELMFERARNWLLGGNTIARAGLAILFLGLAFLVRMVANAGLFPIEVRLALVAVAGAGFVVFGWMKRLEQPSFALSLQGGGVAILYLAVFAAARLYEVLPPVAAFAFMVLFVVLGCCLALLQNALILAMISFLGGFAVPVLLGGDSETPLGLFTYMTLLNVAIWVIAWRRSWRPLNLLGFAATFLLAAAWGFSAFEDRHYLICQAFLILSVALYLSMAVLYAHNTPGKFGAYADSTLLFGTALVGFGLQAGLVEGRPFAAAFSALGFAALYLGVAVFTRWRGQSDMRTLNESVLAIGIGFVTLAIPLALDVKWTAATWALEGAGAFWVGARQARWMPRTFGLLLQAVAALMALAMPGYAVSTLPLANEHFIVPAFVAAAFLLTAWLMRDDLPHSGSSWANLYAPVEKALSQPWFLASFLLFVLAVFRELERRLPAATGQTLPEPVFSTHIQIYLFTAVILLMMALAQQASTRRSWPVAAWPSRLALPVVAMAFFGALVAGRHIVQWPDIAFWAFLIGCHVWLLKRQPKDRWTSGLHVAGVLVATAMVANALDLGVERAALWDTSWAGSMFLLSATAILFGLTRWAGRAAQSTVVSTLAWPLNPFATSYWWFAGVAVAVLVYGGALTSALMAQGVTDPLPYIPIINVVDLSVLLALAAFALWRRTVRAATPLPNGAEPLVGPAGLAAEAFLAFIIINTVWLRTAHHYFDIEWRSDVLAASQVVQSGYSLLWTLIATGMMLFAHRRGVRIAWLSGAILLAIVVLKLFTVDMSRADGLARIIAFIGVGGLMLLIGYFVPLPPRRDDPSEARA